MAKVENNQPAVQKKSSKSLWLKILVYACIALLVLSVIASFIGYFTLPATN